MPLFYTWVGNQSDTEQVLQKKSIVTSNEFCNNLFLSFFKSLTHIIVQFSLNICIILFNICSWLGSILALTKNQEELLLLKLKNIIQQQKMSF